jgi:prolyl-tRNA synthetase
VRGYIGPVGFADEPIALLGEDSVTKIRYLVDPRVVAGTRWVTGANEPGRHVFDLSAGESSHLTGSSRRPRSARAISLQTALDH